MRKSRSSCRKGDTGRKSRRRYWLRGEPCALPSEEDTTDVTRKGLRHRRWANRLIPLRRHDHHGTAVDRQWALEKLRKMTDANRGDAAAKYFTTALQGELLNAPVRLGVDRERTILEALPDRCFVNFQSAEERQKGDVFSLHPLEHGCISRALESEGEPFQPTRRLAKTPFKILDAPDLKDDFYYNLLDWSSNDILAVGLGHAVYVWTAATGKVEQISHHNPHIEDVSSISWSRWATTLAVGGRQGSLKLYDAETRTESAKLAGHPSRVGSLSWNADRLTSGGKDGSIRYWDPRATRAVSVVQGHRSDICGIKWSGDNVHLISGGNDNIVNIWDGRKPDRPLWRINDHTAAVKALAWSPHNSNIFATGGGAKDVTIKIWNLSTMEKKMEMDTQSQICGLHWSQNLDEIVSAHGYNSNTIRVWKASNMDCLGTIPGHTMRILYMTASPNGECIATGSGDESIRFFKIFPPIHRRPYEDENRKEKMHITAR